MSEEMNLTAEQQIRKSLAHRFITPEGLDPKIVEDVIEPIVQYILTGKINNGGK